MKKQTQNKGGGDRERKEGACKSERGDISKGGAGQKAFMGVAQIKETGWGKAGAVLRATKGPLAPLSRRMEKSVLEGNDRTDSRFRTDGDRQMEQKSCPRIRKTLTTGKKKKNFLLR